MLNTRIAIGGATCVMIVLIWLGLGRKILLVVDWCFPGRPVIKGSEPQLIQADQFIVGERAYPIPEGAIKLVLDSRHRIVIVADGHAFTLGPVKTRWADAVKPRYLLVPETGDSVSFQRDLSRLSWQTPFAFSFMGGYIPKRHRYAYDRLRWTKGLGATLEITWRDEQDYFPGSTGWQDAYNNRLTKLRIRPGALEKAAIDYLSSQKHWIADEYRLEMQEGTEQQVLVTVVYLKDETASHPGAGNSIVLRIDRRSGKVIGEAGLQ